MKNALVVNRGLKANPNTGSRTHQTWVPEEDDDGKKRESLVMVPEEIYMGI